MRVLRRNRLCCLIREYDQVTCGDTVSGTYRRSLTAGWKLMAIPGYGTTPSKY